MHPYLLVSTVLISIVSGLAIQNRQTTVPDGYCGVVEGNGCNKDRATPCCVEPNQLAVCVYSIFGSTWGFHNCLAPQNCVTVMENVNEPMDVYSDEWSRLEFDWQERRNREEFEYCCK